ncbi:MAG: hypothetical protein BWZ08_01977 [candidate division BRC1 bacterium ADurb.BinA292]|nr:MAG: hypothetical protein BWZ08_01977 [candidate division BRC1 bacterium ADurb.BinA292]
MIERDTGDVNRTIPAAAADDPPARLEDHRVLPRLLAELLTGRELHGGLDRDDLREMSKRAERPNIWGLPLHPIQRPWPGELDLNGRMGPDGPLAIGPRPELPIGVFKSFQRQLRQTTYVFVRGWVGGASADPLAVAGIFPQEAAHLAAGLQEMLWPMEPASEAAWASRPAHYTFLAWPDAIRGRDGQPRVEMLIGHWPGEGVGLIVGCDDPRALEEVARDAARRRWSARRAIELIRGALDCGGEHARLVWDATETGGALIEEPLVVERGRVSPLWRNPLLPADRLSRADWRAAALDPWALPFGVCDNQEGHLPLLQPEYDDATRRAAAGGWVVVPRRAAPPPGPSRPMAYRLREA